MNKSCEGEYFLCRPNIPGNKRNIEVNVVWDKLAEISRMT